MNRSEKCLFIRLSWNSRKFNIFCLFSLHLLDVQCLKKFSLRRNTKGTHTYKQSSNLPFMTPNLLPKYSKDLLEKNAMESTSDWILLQRRIKSYFVTVSMTVCLYSLCGTTSLGFPFLAFHPPLIPWNKANETAKRILTAHPLGKKKWDDTWPA